MIVNEVVAGAGVDRVRAAAAVDGVGAGAGEDGIRAAGADDRNRLLRQQSRSVEILEVEDGDSVADGLIRSARDRKGDGGHAARGQHYQRVVAGAAVDQALRAVIVDRVIAGAGIDRVSSADAVDGVGARTGRDRIRRARPDDIDARADQMGVEVFEIRHGDGVADRLIVTSCYGEIDGRNAAGRIEDERIDAHAAVDACLGPMIVHCVVAGAGKDRIQAAAAVDGVRSGAAEQLVGVRRAGDRRCLKRREARGVDVLEVKDVGHAAAGLIGGVGEVDRRRNLEIERIDAAAAVDDDFRAPEVDDVVMGARDDGIRAAAAVDRVVAGSGQDRVAACRAGDGKCGAYRCRVQVFEIRHRDRVADRLVKPGMDGQIDRRDSAAADHHEGVVARAAVDRGFRAVVGNDVVAGPAEDRVGSAIAVDGVAAAAGADHVGDGGTRQAYAGRQRARVDVFKIRDDGGVACRLIRRMGKVYGRRNGQLQRVVAAAAIDDGFGAMIDDGVVARPGVDRVRSAAAVDGVVA